MKKRALECAAKGDSSFQVHVSNEEDTFTVSTPTREYCFRNNGRGLYMCDLADEVEEAGAALQ